MNRKSPIALLRSIGVAMFIGLALLPNGTGDGHAYELLSPECGTGAAPDGTSWTYRIKVGDFTSAEIAAIETGAAMWTAGTSSIMRGAQWEWVRGADITTGAILNTKREVYKKSSLWLDQHGAVDADDEGGILGLAVVTGTCTRPEADVILNADLLSGGSSPRMFKMVRPGAGNSSDYSLPQVVAHEFGHVFGLDHQEGFSSIMNPVYDGIESGAALRMGEDEYLALRTMKSASSTGTNLLISKYSFDATALTGKPQVLVGLNCGGFQYYVNDGVCESELDRTWHALALTHSTSTVTGVDVAWFASPDADCDDVGDNIEIGRNSGLSLGVGAPFDVRADSITMPSTPGTYWICIKIDPDDEITETSENDNVVRIMSPFTVYP